MKFTIAITLTLAISCAFAMESPFEFLSAHELGSPANDYALIDEINAKATTWKAGPVWPESFTVADVVDRLGGMPDFSEYPEQEELEVYTAPDSFDFREAFPDCVKPIRDQARCGSCWAFAETEALTDRFCSQSNGEITVELAPQDPVSCDKGNMGCRGGYLAKGWKYLEKSGCVTEECMPYTSGEGDRGKCPKNQCTGEGEWKKYYAKKGSSKKCNGEKKMKEEISTNGPIEIGFIVYKDFTQYTKGIYQHTTGGRLGGHAVKVIGYGEEDGVKYWLVANSWGARWGEKGFYRIVRGTNECGMEKQTIAGMADLERV